MRVGSWYSLEFVSGLDFEAVAEEAEELPLTRARPIFVSQNMRVVLLPDPNFEIKPKSKSLQDTGPDLTATWQWDVKPLTIGTHTLIAQVDVLKPEKSGGYSVFNRYSRRVSVRVGVGTLQALIEDIRGAKSLGDALTSLLKSWRATLLALAGLIGAYFVVRWAIRKGKKRPVSARRERKTSDSP
jgi:hypothetical protein